MSDDALTEQIRDELARLVPIISELTGLPSNWNRQVILVPDADFNGKKSYSCSILIDSGLADSDLRWRTLIHEALHAVSVGYNRSDYEDAVGWEEGVVEQLQRLLRPQVLQRLDVIIDEEMMTRYEATHRFNTRIAALERLRFALNRWDDIAFYSEMLATPIKDRPALMLARSLQTSGAMRSNLIRVFSSENSLLKTPVTKGT